MNCPVCNVQLLLSERQGVEIDYCPQCRGVWLDRGELDKIIEKSKGGHTESSVPSKHYEQHAPQGQYKKHKKKSWLEDLLDFD